MVSRQCIRLLTEIYIRKRYQIWLNIKYYYPE